MLSISALSVLGSVGWWVTWPKRTARQFVELVAAQKLDEASRMLAPEPFKFRLNLNRGVDWWNNAKLESGWRTPDDLFLGRQGFAFGTIFFTIERGTVIKLFNDIDR